MRVTRKEFLSTLAAGLAGTVLRPSRLLAASPSPDENISLETFQKYVGTSFRVIRPNAETDANFVLQEVTRGQDSNGTVQFSLSFLAHGGEILEEKTYRFEHPEMGAIPIFVTKVKTDRQGQTWYRADYNLLAAAQNGRKTATVPGRR
jgi:hypothetical protein